jgi:hypothetical protein
MVRKIQSKLRSTRAAVYSRENPLGRFPVFAFRHGNGFCFPVIMGREPDICPPVELLGYIQRERPPDRHPSAPVETYVPGRSRRRAAFMPDFFCDKIDNIPCYVGGNRDNIAKIPDIVRAGRRSRRRQSRDHPHSDHRRYNKQKT